MPGVKFKQIPPLSKADEDRFWVNVKRDANDRGCWLWSGNRNSKGYGRFYFKKSIYSAHRVSRALAGREVPGDLQIRHTCDTPLCVNPDHLVMVDIVTNQRDAKLKRNLSGKRKAIKKPRPDFPLFPHATGRWAKKVRGKLVYFGQTIDDPKGERALQLWADQKDDLLAGRTPRTKAGGLTVHNLANHFMLAKEQQRDAGDITHRSYDDYHATGKLLLDAFGKERLVNDLAADDFQALRASLAKRYGVHRLSKIIQHVRTIFKFGYDAGLIDQPVRFGPAFKKPAARLMRAHRQKNGKRMFEADELQAIIAGADQPMKAMILLGVNCGFGNHDVGMLPKSAVDLTGGWLDFPRPKTAVERRCPLWPESIQAIREAIDQRPKPKKLADTRLVFLTTQGQPWARDNDPSVVTKEFRKLLDRRRCGQCGRIQSKVKARSDGKEKLLWPKQCPACQWKPGKDMNWSKLYRPGLGFYALRHTFETIAGDSRDQAAINAIMGHVDSTMAGVYRERISDDRLRAVVEFVRQWLFDKLRRTRITHHRHDEWVARIVNDGSPVSQFMLDGSSPDR